jgi:hypothetical protein
LILPRFNPGTVEFYHRRIAEAPQVLFATDCENEALEI